jgi:hypothetical protein
MDIRAWSAHSSRSWTMPCSSYLSPRPKAPRRRAGGTLRTLAGTKWTPPRDCLVADHVPLQEHFGILTFDAAGVTNSTQSCAAVSAPLAPSVNLLRTCCCNAFIFTTRTWTWTWTHGGLRPSFNKTCFNDVASVATLGAASFAMLCLQSLPWWHWTCCLSSRTTESSPTIFRHTLTPMPQHYRRLSGIRKSSSWPRSGPTPT